MLTIHQPRPEIFRNIDNLFVVGKGGKKVFDGKPQDAENLFKRFASDSGILTQAKADLDLANISAADLILDVLSIPEASKMMADEWQLREACGTTNADQPEHRHGDAAFLSLDFGGPWAYEQSDIIVTSLQQPIFVQHNPVAMNLLSWKNPVNHQKRRQNPTSGYRNRFSSMYLR